MRDTGVLQATYNIKGGSTELRPPIVLKEHVVYPTLTTLEVYMRDGRFVRSTPLTFAVRTNGAGLGTSVFVCGDYPDGGGARKPERVTKPALEEASQVRPKVSRTKASTMASSRQAS